MFAKDDGSIHFTVPYRIVFTCTLFVFHVAKFFIKSYVSHRHLLLNKIKMWCNINSGILRCSAQTLFLSPQPRSINDIWHKGIYAYSILHRMVSHVFNWNWEFWVLRVKNDNYSINKRPIVVIHCNDNN